MISFRYVWIMFGVSTVLWSLIAWYVDNVKPGPFGQARPLYFLFLVLVIILKQKRTIF